MTGETLKLELKNICVWNKLNGGMGSLYRSQHEMLAIFKLGRAPHINNIELGRHGRYRTNVWSYAGASMFRRGRQDDLAVHPTVKPIALVVDAIKDCFEPQRHHPRRLWRRGDHAARRRTHRTTRPPDRDRSALRRRHLGRWHKMTGNEPKLIGQASTEEAV